MDAQNFIEQIRSDNVSGAAMLTRKAAEAFLFPARRESQLTVAALGRALVAAQPLMAPIVNLVNSVLWSTDTARAAQSFLDQLDIRERDISKHAAALIREGMTVMTHSYSQTILRVLLAAKESGHRFEVICTESRPVCEGVELARALGAAGVPVTLIADAAIYSSIGNAELVLTGADAVSDRGVVNKIGTALLAIAAREWGVPFYVVCGSDKILPAGYVLPAEASKPSSEITAEVLRNTVVRNFYFEATPLDLVTGVITETGMQSVKQIHEHAARQALHPELQIPERA